MINADSKKQASKTAELAFADFEVESIGCPSDFTGGNFKRFSYGKGTGAEDAILFGCFVQQLFQLCLLLIGRGFVPFVVMHA